MTKFRSIIIAATAVGTMFLVPSCMSDPCGNLSAPSARDLQAAKDGYEVEREGEGDTECELNQSGNWVAED